MEPKKTLLDRVRCTKATRRRMTNLKDSVEEFKKQPMTQVEYSIFLNFSASGARKYLRDLQAAGILIAKEETDVDNNTLRYYLTEDSELVERFMKTLEANMTSASESPSAQKQPSLPANIAADRKFHVMTDDTTFKVRVERNTGEGRRDPLVAALFGAPKSSYSPIVEMCEK